MKRNSIFIKSLAAFTAVNFLGQILFPTAAYALTGGPSQPEVQSFEPVSTSDMVNLFNGNFNYNIPLMQVPGPNGGYPINLHYHAGIGMEQEASWVGLGWNINVGSINRQMRGLPDDFKGEKVVKKTNLRPNRTVGLGFSTSVNSEVLGANLGLNNQYQLYYNNYQGIGARFNANLTSFGAGLTDNGLYQDGVIPSVATSFDSERGLGFTPTLSYRFKANGEYLTFAAGVGYNSRQGIEHIQLGLEHSGSYEEEETAQKNSKLTMYESQLFSGGGSGTSFAMSSAVPMVNSDMIGKTARVRYATGVATNSPIWVPDQNYSATLTVQRLTDEGRDFEAAAYGYMYAEDAPQSDEEYMTDFRREHDAGINRRTPHLPVPVMMHDVYAATGQGFGGVFRLHRNDIGVVHDNVGTSISNSSGTGFEWSTPTSTEIKFGADYSLFLSRSYTGAWQEDGQEILASTPNDALGFQPKEGGISTYEPSYFKASGEATYRPTTDLDNVGGEDPVNFDLSMKFKADGLSFRPYVHNRISGTSPYGIEDNKREEREIRNQHFQYRTVDQITNDANHSNQVDYLYGSTGKAYPHFDYAGSSAGIDYPTAVLNSQIGEITTLSPTGERYVYGLPAYNHVQKDVAFALDATNAPSGNAVYDNKKITDYNAGSASVDNTDGDDHFFSSTEMPAYPYSYLLTTVLSQDYVDLTGDGPTDDDFGYYCKFNYDPLYDDVNPYRWRIPYSGANYTKGKASDHTDDRGSYTYGEKDVYYLNSIETKTHIAIFILEEREDAMGVNQEERTQANPQDPTLGGSKLKRLKEIRLYSKNDVTTVSNGLPDATPIKVVHFEYDYSLCGAVENNSGASVTGNSTKGKLTLKKVWFTYLGNEKGALSPYQFAYNSTTGTNTYQNPDYDLMQMDRWGNYQPDNVTEKRYNNENPYTLPSADYDENNAITGTDEDLRNNAAGAWSLRQIILPSGGVVEVDYEADDYAYVQDERAQQMLQIVGTSKHDDSDYLVSTEEEEGELGKNYTRVYFKLKNPIQNLGQGNQAAEDAEVLQYIAGIEELYFKTWQRLKLFPGSTSDWAYGYVDGYAEIENTVGTYGVADNTDTNGDYIYGYFTVKQDEYRSGAMKAHPFRFAGWQHLRYSRQDLFQRPSSSFNNGVINTSVLTDMLQLINDQYNVIFGYYMVAASKSYNKHIDIDGRPSYVRLNSPDYIKYGGGHRVSKIALKDAWDSSDERSYGQTYTYRLPNGQSSGVAEYEPLVGGEENALKKPIWYNDNDATIAFRNKSAFLETPLGEAYYPAANVGYSRVEVRSLQATGVEQSGAGVTVSEFFTAKDFPIQVEWTELQSKHFNPLIPIPFMGARKFNNHGYSQGYSISLNDMHGKPKAQGTYPHATDFSLNPEAQPTFETRNTYFTDPSKTNALKNEVQVLHDDAFVTSGLLGQTYDFFVDMKEVSNVSRSTGFAFNSQSNTIAAGVIIPTAFGIYEKDESVMRYVVTNKIIYKTGIPKSTQVYSEGAYTTTENLMFDAKTGLPLLTRVTNEWDKPIYNYQFASHWSYEGMESAYQNQGIELEIYWDAAALEHKIRFLSGSQKVSDFLTSGDELVQTTGTSRQHYWVKTVDDDGFQLEASDATNPQTGTLLSPTKVYVERSGHRNLQAVSTGGIVALDNPVSDRVFPLFEAFNNAASPASFTYTLCDGSASDNVAASISGQSIHFDAGDRCDGYVTFPSTHTMQALGDYTLTKMGSTVKAEWGTGNTVYADWSDEWGCYQECLNNVLHASAVEFSDNLWTYNYQDVMETVPAALTAGNDHRYGRAGIWRSHRTNLFQVDRKQFNGQGESTQIDEDGVYEYFQLFNWKSPTSNDNTLRNDEVNKDWIWTDEVTQYSPYGFALESRNVLDIYSTEMLGYANSVMVSVATNSRYMEQAFDGFEDYNANNYGTSGHGHFNFQVESSGTAPTLSTSQAHTGNVSMRIPAGTTIMHDEALSGTQYLKPQADQQYLLSFWVYHGDADAIAAKVSYGSMGLLASLNTGVNPGPVVEGWMKVEVPFTIDSSNPSYVALEDLTIEIEHRALSTGTEVFVDDIRCHPFKGGMNTYVYDPATLWLIAELDNWNFATYYDYDEEGQLTQVKKETLNGIVTLSTSRSNVVQQ